MYEIVIYLIAIAAFLAAVRLAKGPSAPDRIIAVDSISSLVVAGIVVISLYFGISMLIDIAIVYAILSFVGTLAVSKFLLGKKISEE